MLKRQRTSTPPPTSESVAELAGDLNTFNHTTKRRRIVSPILDGRERGMEIEFDNDELDYESNTDVAVLSREQKPGHYTLINKLLGNLHVEHRLRRRAPSSESPTCTAGTTPHVPRNLQTPPKNAHLGPPQRPQETRSASSEDENTIYKRFNEFNCTHAKARSQLRSSLSTLSPVTKELFLDDLYSVH